jgi:nucleotide-binding universal stress UspA family protein
MTPFRTILLATDFSENSRQAFRAASSLAAEDKTRLVILHVVDPTEAREEPGDLGRSTEATRGEQGQRDRDYLAQKLCDAYVPNHAVDVERHVRHGDIPAEILRMAREVGADLIAMGTHGRTGLRRMLTGSIANAVLRGAPCPVLALRAGAGSERGRQIQVILHPTDFSESSEPALGLARTLARNTGARLVILHVVPVGIVMGTSMAAQIDPQYCQDALDAIRSRLDGPDLKYPMETRLVHGLEPEAIVRAATEVKADLIVMGTHGRTGLSRALMGSVAASVLARADCPVMVVKSLEHLTTAPAGHSTENKAVIVI